MSFLNGTDPGLRQTKVPVVDTYTAGSGFTAGSTTTLTLSEDPGSENACEVSFDGILQHGSTFTHSGTTLTFSSAIPTGVSEVQVRHAGAIPATTPADASVTQAKLGNEAVNEAKLQVSNAPTNGYFLSAQSGNTGGLTWAEAGGGIVQVVHTQIGSSASGTTTMPGDNTTPQNSEGVEFITRAITPTSASNKLLIQAFLQCTFSSGGDTISYALFQDSTADALASGIEFNDSTNVFSPLSLTHYMTAGTTSETTFKVRVGTNSSGTMYLNKMASGGDMHNGLLATTMTIWEISV